MGFLLGFLTMPLLGAPRLVNWLATTILEEAQAEYLDEGSIRSELLLLQWRFDAGDLEEDEYDRQEKALLDHLTAVRKLKLQHST